MYTHKFCHCNLYQSFWNVHIYVQLLYKWASFLMIFPLFSVANVVAVFIRKNDGERIAELADQGLQVKLQMHVVPHYNITYSGSSHVTPNQPAVLILSILVSGTMVVFPLLLANCEKFSRYWLNKRWKLKRIIASGCIYIGKS